MKTRILFLLTAFCLMASSWTPPTFTIEDQHNAYLEKAKKAQFIFEGRNIGYEIHQIGNKGFPKCYIRRKVQITKIYKGHDSLSFKTVEIVSGPDYCSGPSSDSTFVHLSGSRAIFICNINKQPVPPAVNFTAEIPLRLHKIAFYHLQGYSGFGDIEKQFIHKLKQLPGIEVKTQKSNKNSFKSTSPSKKKTRRTFIDSIPAEVYARIARQKEWLKKKGSSRAQGTADFIFEMTNPRNFMKPGNPGVKFMEFDVMVSSTEDVYLSDLALGIQYETDKFYANSKANEKVEVTLSSHFSENYEYFSAYDESDTNNVLNIALYNTLSCQDADGSSTLLTSTPKKLCTVVFEVKALNEYTQFKFYTEDFANTSYVYTLTEGTDVDYCDINDIFAVSDFTMSNPPQWDMKPTPVVNGFEVSGAPGIPIDSIEAGTQKVLVIKGEGFGNLRDNGVVKFINADAPTGEPITLEEYDYNVGASLSGQTNPGEYWTDTLIRVLVPTVSEDQEKNKYTAGTGDVIVQNAWAEDNTLQALWGFYKKS